MPGASELANTLATALLQGSDFNVDLPDFSGADFEIPDNSDIDDPIANLTIADLTDATVDGAGAFDKLMKGLKAHLRLEYDAGRITGDQYSKTYIALTEGAMANATQFVLGKEAAHWAAIGAQLQAQIAQVGLVTARVQMVTAKTQLQMLKLEALNAQATFARNKLALATESVNFDRAKYELDNIMPQQLALAQKQVERIDAEIVQTEKQNELTDKNIALAQGEVDNIPAKADLLSKQITGQQNQNTILVKEATLRDKQIALGDDQLLLLKKQVLYQVAQTDQLTKQGTLIDKQIAVAQAELDLQPQKLAMLNEQIETQRAQTLDNRRDGAVVTGSVGKQKALYSQQIISYQRDAEVKAAKIFSDAWVTMKTIDEGLAPPTSFANANLDQILTVVKVNNNLTTG